MNASYFTKWQRSVLPFIDSAYTLEITGKAIAQIVAAQNEIPKGTPINIAFLGNEDHEQRVKAAQIIRSSGFEPVPIISSRRLLSEHDRDQIFNALKEVALPQRYMLVGGDPAQPLGPFYDSISLLQSNILERFSIRHIGVAGYPEGHPKIDNEQLWKSLKWKLEFLNKAGCSVEITTQFGFDTRAVVLWLKELREAGIDVPVRIGIPGPADVGKLLRYARQFGVTTSAAIMRRYGLALTSLMQKSVADRYLSDLNTQLSHQDYGVVRYHLYPFGGVTEAVSWMNGRLRDG